MFSRSWFLVLLFISCIGSSKNLRADAVNPTLSQEWKNLYDKSITAGYFNAFDTLLREFIAAEHGSLIDRELFGSLVNGTGRDTYFIALTQLQDLWQKISEPEKSTYEGAASRFFNELTENLDEIQKYTRKAYRYLFTKSGFKIFQTIGNHYFEQSNLVKAIRYWEEALRFSLDGWNTLPDAQKFSFLSNLYSAYGAMDWKSRYQYLPSNNISTNQLLSILENAGAHTKPYIYNTKIAEPGLAKLIKALSQTTTFETLVQGSFVIDQNVIRVGQKLYGTLLTNRTMQVGWFAYDLDESRVTGGHLMSIDPEYWPHHNDRKASIELGRVSDNGSLMIAITILYCGSFRYDIDLATDQMSTGFIGGSHRGIDSVTNSFSSGLGDSESLVEAIITSKNLDTLRSGLLELLSHLKKNQPGTENLRATLAESLIRAPLQDQVVSFLLNCAEDPGREVITDLINRCKSNLYVNLLKLIVTRSSGPIQATALHALSQIKDPSVPAFLEKYSK